MTGSSTALASALVLVATLAATATVAMAQVQPSSSNVSVVRIRARLDAPQAARRLRLDAALPVATFRTSVEQRVYMLTFQEWLKKEFTLTPMQQQSQNWSSQCCGIDILGLIDGLDRRLKRREAGKIREQVSRERAAVEAASKKQ